MAPPPLPATSDNGAWLLWLFVAVGLAFGALFVYLELRDMRETERPFKPREPAKPAPPPATAESPGRTKNTRGRRKRMVYWS